MKQFIPVSSMILGYFQVKAIIIVIIPFQKQCFVTYHDVKCDARPSTSAVM